MSHKRSPQNDATPPTGGAYEGDQSTARSLSQPKAHDLSHLHIRSDLRWVGLGYRVTFEFNAGPTDARWIPRVLQVRDLNRLIKLGLYAMARDFFAEEMAARLGGAVFVVEAY